ncbi:hypothetical protein GobsT_16560 [Gemmata obscuriglobus]|uniref:DUF1501 domain-containing protein n=1 Tax=Gemmata obscuriglobus TaxID=114 RepID=A0A2Z3GZK5_9BACT|nr:DUF1501 domain-containing protein [Gemmata obscuriglobus]AWM39949.1 DUF1501 domain-containing protein [Gemmata obscuriglobus]QEG26908.1 hypothetical protein GobsT_16560 [Gemmata obscuriglobus]VTS03015.1 secreted protein containing duf1501 : Uncharacterized protein OS=Pirellula staleyi (strain ATCC 27377 / DSM 6068 / ICPB 4128) GN=Psta_0321 PE=4 SV=1: DUF1501 [Gemmata obscuriglobus UQM 2246]
MRTFTNPLTRRGLFRSAAGAGLGAGFTSGWLRALAAGAPKKPAKSVIVLWLDGGPATIDLWDLKPGHANGGPFRAIDTAAPGLKIGEHLPKLAKLGKDLAVVRSMSTKEGDHGRATYLLRTGYTPLGAIQYPAAGAVIAKELGAEAGDLPNFVSVAPARNAASGGGFLGPHFDPLVVGELTAPQDGLKVPDLARTAGVGDDAQRARLELLAGAERQFAAGRESAVAGSVRAATARAVRLMKPEAAAAFDLEQEKPKARDAYGRGLFGQGCLLARRLVERGVPFVEVTLDGWDTHQNNFDRVKDLCGALDAGFAALLADLKDRGMLDSTLVVCQGEFGRTPKINGNTGRDHWPASWAVALAGGGLKTGQAVGRTSTDGAAVEDKPRGVPDLIATVAKAVGIDPKKQNMSNVGRPIRVADPDAEPIKELL